MTVKQQRPAFFGIPALGMIIAFLIALVYSFANQNVSLHDSGLGSHPGKGSAQSEAYNLGAESASALYMLRSDTISLNNYLLEVRAQEWSIRHNFGEQIAEDYLRGFENKITELSDSLAAILFNNNSGNHNSK